MKISELLQEAGIQAELKAAFKVSGTIADHAGDFADAVAGALEAKPTEKAYVLSPSTPAQKAAAQSIRNAAKRMGDGFDVARLTGGRKVVVINNKIITGKYQYDHLVS